MKSFFTPSPLTVAQRELLEAQHRLLAAQSAVEYANAMVAYESARVQRLKLYLEEHGNSAYENA